MSEMKSLNGYEIVDAKARENLEGLSTYVTPKMFGAKGDGVTDDTAAIVAALATGKTVVLDKTYLIDTLTPPMGADIVVNGKLIVNGTINIYYPNIKFTGSGKIKCEGAVCFTLKGIGKADNTYCKNFYIGHELTVEGYMNRDCTAFLITAEEGKDGIVVYPEINCKIAMFTYGIHSLYSGTDNAWFTSLRCGSLIENCRYAIIFDWHGNGSVFDGVIQPIVSTTPNTDDIPLVKVTNNCTIKGMVWDMGSAPNKYAVYVEGTRNSIDVTTDYRYVFCKDIGRNHIASNANYFFDVSSAFMSGNKTQFVDLPFDNTNDLTINAGNNKVGLSVTPASLANAAKDFFARTGNQSLIWFISKDLAPDGVVMEFEFPSRVALRQLFVTGEKMPSSVKFEYKNASDEWIELKTCVRDVDYANNSGAENYAWWQFVYDYYAGLEFNKNFAKGVRITMNIDDDVRLSRIYIGAVGNNMPTKMGDDLIATSFKIKGNDGIFYNVTVNGGTLVATAET